MLDGWDVPVLMDDGLDPDWNGVGPYRHTIPGTAPSTCTAAMTPHTGPVHPSSLLLPIVPERE